MKMLFAIMCVYVAGFGKPVTHVHIVPEIVVKYLMCLILKFIQASSPVHIAWNFKTEKLL